MEKDQFVAYIKEVISDPSLPELKKTNFVGFIDRVTDVFEYMVEHFIESQSFVTPAFRQVASKTADDNLRESRKMIALKNNPPHVLERLVYLCLVLERFLFLNQTCPGA